MDPFSITVGVVGLADAGTTLAGFLTDKYKSYRDAPELILEIAHEVEFCAGLVDMFGSSLDRPGVKYPERFVRDAKGLVERVCCLISPILEYRACGWFEKGVIELRSCHTCTATLTGDETYRRKSSSKTYAS
jgi:hypothetical protein